MNVPKKIDTKVLLIHGKQDEVSIAIAQDFIHLGYIVYFITNQKSQQQQNPLPENCLLLTWDEHESDSIEILIKGIYDRHHNIDTLINYAIPTDGSLNMNWNVLVDAALKNLMTVIEAVSPYMLLNNYGRIINTTASLGFFGEMPLEKFTAVKKGVLGINKLWAQELSRHQITVNAVSPGYIKTSSNQLDTQFKNITEKIPSRRLGTIKELIPIFSFLASDQSAYITGAEIPIDGGYQI